MTKKFEPFDGRVRARVAMKPPTHICSLIINLLSLSGYPECVSTNLIGPQKNNHVRVNESYNRIACSLQHANSIGGFQESRCAWKDTHVMDCITPLPLPR